MSVVLEQFEVLKRAGVDRGGGGGERSSRLLSSLLLSDKLLSREAIRRLESDLTTQVMQTFTHKHTPYINLFSLRCESASGNVESEVSNHCVNNAELPIILPFKNRIITRVFVILLKSLFR
jgi:hypothetical protein